MKKVKNSANSQSLIAKYNPQFGDYKVDLFVKHPQYIGDDNEGIENLKCSLVELGQGRPVIARLLEDGKLEILEGSRVIHAARQIGWHTISAAVLTIEEDEVFPLMCALGGHNRKFRYKILAQKFEALKKHARGLLEEGQLPHEDGASPEVRNYLQSILGFGNAKYVSGFETIINSSEKDAILDFLEKGTISMAKAIRMASGKCDAPKADPKSYKDKSGMQMCCGNACPRFKEFYDKMNDESDFSDDVNNL